MLNAEEEPDFVPLFVTFVIFVVASAATSCGVTVNVVASTRGRSLVEET